MEELIKWIGGAEGGSFKNSIIGIPTAALSYASIVIVALGAYCFWIGPSVVWYAFKFNVSTDAVHIAPKPTDCDFWHAPVGFKGCHYEKAPFIVSGPDGRVLYISWAKETD